MSIKYSYSKLGTYKNCPFSYKLQYVDGNYIFVGSIATEFGTAIHESEEAVGNYIKNKQPIEYNKLKNDFIIKCLKLQAKYPKDFYERDTKSFRTYKDKMYEYLESGIYRLEKYMSEHPTYEIIGLEQKFNFEYDEKHTFTGAIDRAIRDTATNKYIIQDIKSWAVEADKKDLTTPLQFVVYCLAAEKLWGCNPEDVCCEYDLPLVDLRQLGGTPGYINRGIKKIEELFSKIAVEDYTPKPSQLCHWCNYCRTNENAPENSKYLCPYYMKWTREDKNFSKEFDWKGLDEHPIIMEEYRKRYCII